MESLKRFSLGLLAAAIIMLAIVMWGLRLALVNIDYFKSEIEYLLARDVGPDIVFTGVSGDINRFNPILRIENISLTLPDRSQPLFIDRLTVEFDFWASLREWAPVLLEVSGRLEKIELTRDASGRWWADELELGLGSGEPSISDITQHLAFVPRYLKLTLNRLIIRDQRNDVSHQLERVSAYINYQGEQFVTRIAAALPDELGQGILLKSVLGDERSLVYLNVSNLRANPVAELFDIDTWGLRDGSFDGELWINLDDMRAVAISGDIVLKNGSLQVSADQPPLMLSYHTQFNAFNRGGSWRVNNRVDRLNLDDNVMQGFSTQLQFATDQGQRRLSVLVERMQLLNLPPVAAQFLPPEIGGLIRRGNLKGLIEDLALSIDLERPEELYLRTRVRGLDSEPVGRYPGVGNLNVDLLIGNNRGAVNLSGRGVSLDFGDHFRAPLALDEFSLSAQAQRRDSGLLLAVDRVHAANADIKLDGRIWLEADQHDRPFVYMRAGFRDGNGSSKGKYLPLKILPPKALAWLDRGIRNGRVTRGGFQFHGRMRDIRELERDKAGEFFVDFEVEDAEVFFAPGWEPARDGAGRVLFHNVGVEIDLDQVSYDDIDQARARARIAEYDSGVLELAIHSVAPAAAGVATWLNTPVGTDFRQTFANLHDFQGKIKADIGINLLLSGERDPRVEVALDLDAAGARSKNWGLDLSAINGRVHVTDTEIRASQIKANYFGDPVSIDIEPEQSSARTLVHTVGRLNTGNLLQRMPPQLRAKINGESEWQLRLSIAEKSSSAEQPLLRLNAASNLVGTSLSFPSPFAKDAEMASRVSLDLDFYRDSIEASARLGDQVAARGRFRVESVKDIRMDRLDVAFATELKSEARPGLNLYGYIPHLSIADWVETIKVAGEANPTVLQSAELVVEEVLAYNRPLNSVTLEVSQTEQGFVGKIDSAQLKGSFAALQRQPISIDLEHLRIDKLEQESDYADLLPSAFRDLRLRSQALEYHGMQFRDLEVDLRVDGDTLWVDNFAMRRDQIRLDGNGKWAFDPGSNTHDSSLSLSVKGESFGQAVAGLGVGDAINGGKIDLTGQFSWPSSIMAFELENIVADARLELTDGVLNNVEPGSGRFVGLMSLSALPRRLSLDFRDVLIKGMEFDKIFGTYRLAQGVLYTEDTEMDGPGAKIRVSGKTGIIERNYDQSIRVTPKIRQTLPVIGAVSAGSTVGWGLLLLQNLFKKAIDKAVEVEYKISGSWDDPNIELVKAVDENQEELPNIER